MSCELRHGMLEMRRDKNISLISHLSQPNPHPISHYLTSYFYCAILSSPKALCSACTALFPCSALTTQEILISDVAIIWILIFSSASVSNILEAVPGCETIPIPTRETLQTSSSE